ncbi:protease Do-like protein 1, chloroplastic [Tanacetum coccineum]|uniref:Protease Do-like protein 1, chloroplastic n=1 Tax=Tanacetum coccineum TaxID=301880 RepID=A0ABQ4ZXB9_9ASTR
MYSRVPTVDESVADLTVRLEKSATYVEIRAAIQSMLMPNTRDLGQAAKEHGVILLMLKSFGLTKHFKLLSCVCIHGRPLRLEWQTSTMGKNAKASRSGSGFVWDKNGHIVTNYHVIRGASDLRVTLANQTTYDAKVIGFDQDKDVVVLQIDAPKDKLRPRPVGVYAEYLYQLVLTTQPIR